MDTQRWRRQDGLIREALYIFLVVALVMAILLDGVAMMKVQQSARDLASDAGREAQTHVREHGGREAGASRPPRSTSSTATAR